jgi:hypothetical protein
MALLYLLILVPQLRLLNYKYDPHIGNFIASRVSGKNLSSIFFKYNFGVPIPALSLSIQYDYFKNNFRKYKLLHAIIVAGTGPLFYTFVNVLINNELVSFISSIIYVISFHFPVVGNWLIQSEH